MNRPVQPEVATALAQEIERKAEPKLENEIIPTGARIAPVPLCMLVAAKQQAQVALLKALTRAAENYDKQAINAFGQALQQVLEIK